MGYIEAMHTPVTTMPEFTLKQWIDIRDALSTLASTRFDDARAATQPKEREFYIRRYEELSALADVIGEVTKQLRDQAVWG